MAAAAKSGECDRAAICIQSVARGFLARRRCGKCAWCEPPVVSVGVFRCSDAFDETFASFGEGGGVATLPPARAAFVVYRRFLLYLDQRRDASVGSRSPLLNGDGGFQRFDLLCRYLVLSCSSVDAACNCVSVALTREHTVAWVSTLKRALQLCSGRLAALDVRSVSRRAMKRRRLQPRSAHDEKLASLYLNTLVTFTACNAWAVVRAPKGESLRPLLARLCANVLAHLVANGLYTHLSQYLHKSVSRVKPLVRRDSLAAVAVVAIRPLSVEDWQAAAVAMTFEILVAPAFVLHLQVSCPETAQLLVSQGLFAKVVTVLSLHPQAETKLACLPTFCALTLVANVIHLASLDSQAIVGCLLDFTHLVRRLLDACASCMVVRGKNAQTHHWHPLFGWYTKPLDDRTQCALPLVTKQLQLLWGRGLVRALFRDVGPSPSRHDAQSAGKADQRDVSNAVKALVRKLREKQQRECRFSRLGSAEATLVALVCALYRTALCTLTQLHTDILSGLCREDFLMPRLWHFISTMGTNNGLTAFLDLLSENPKGALPEFQIMFLFFDAASCLMSILDESEVYDDQKPFELRQLVDIARFTNGFVFRCIWNEIISVKNAATHELFNAALHFNMVLYNRDCRRAFTSGPQFWLAEGVRPSAFVAELKRGSGKAQLLVQRAPHLLPQRDRIVLFRGYVAADRAAVAAESSTSTLITIHRPRIVEDGFRQLARLSNNALKGAIRVKFVNEQGLDEAGIDQDGVFKEFLEEIIKKIFDADLNLFNTTADGRLYPSPTSHLHENHLALFDFVGRILGKAVYEGIVVDVPFAPFFLNNMLGRRYSALDELPSLDPQLYKNLTYVKHYEGDVADLELTFSVDSDGVGERATHDLLPGGRTVAVTNDNRIHYVHKMAAFRMDEQIRAQVGALVGGFQQLVAASWLALFSANELHALVAGQTDDVDVADLRRHTQYYGGFHSGHRLIHWLWHVLEHDFDAAERRLFLKFTTSCSRAPLLGFEHLDPAFSIRCVEVSDEQDQGDTLGSVIRGFLAVRRRQPTARLPTSSTCFNLLKLPNYQKKAVLREKLRYAIHSGTGFELS